MNVTEAVELAINNTLEEGLTDIFPNPYEVELLRNSEFRTKFHNECVTKLNKRNIKDLGLLTLHHALVPKSSHPYDYRRGAIISPLCSVKYLALALLAAPTIESKRVHITKRTVFSHRFAPHGAKLYSDDAGYKNWKEEIVNRRNDPHCKVVVKCDISGFYDNINLHRLNSTLLSIGVEPWLCHILV